MSKYNTQHVNAKRRVRYRSPNDSSDQVYSPPYTNMSRTIYKNTTLPSLLCEKRGGWVVRNPSEYVCLWHIHSGITYSCRQLYMWEGKGCKASGRDWFSDWPRMNETELQMFELSTGADLRVAVEWVDEIYELLGEPKR